MCSSMQGSVRLISPDFIVCRDPTKTLNFRRRGSLEGHGANPSTKELVNLNSLHYTQIPAVRSQQYRGDSKPLKKFDPKSVAVGPADNGQMLVKSVQNSVDLNQNSAEVQQNSVAIDSLNETQNSVTVQQNSVIVDKNSENSGNWPLVKSGVFVDWTNNIQLNAKVKHN